MSTAVWDKSGQPSLKSGHLGAEQATVGIKEAIMRIAVVLWLLSGWVVPEASAATPGASGAVEQAPTLSPKEKD